ncbi:RdgB/HAM1 family non-canonical purine NTP pyrophosphatase [Candidatus Falkowbacteria bacterium]|nr:RdgB/HAM1 family non-canonical purine NTP pyrophosphatase [Candidatus Falkowbacteria bacterium]
MKKIVFATHNQGKIIEMKEILKGLPLEIISAEEAGVTEEPVEDGKTFAENALIKARYVASKTGEWSIADDSGLCIAALDNEPGVHTARWGGEAGQSVGLAQYALNRLGDKENRQAEFFSAVALVSPQGEEHVFQGSIAGAISDKLCGEAHPKLPYDQVFMPNGYKHTFAEMPREEKNKMSHRGQAFLLAKDWLEKNIVK